MITILAKKRVQLDGDWDAAEPTDEDLLDRYLSATEPESQEAFRELVVRHGPMVLGVCRHVLNQAEDAEDAFQATFLVLAQQGATIRDRRVLSGWLHEVAYRIANRLRTSTMRRRTLERQGMAMLPAAGGPDDQIERAAWGELRPVLHEEINRLPAKYRLPVILSYLEGKSNEEVAELLQWPVGSQGPVVAGPRAAPLAIDAAGPGPLGGLPGDRTVPWPRLRRGRPVRTGA
jgi:RNA polymerase sigma factor (sigma-70 family)